MRVDISNDGISSRARAQAEHWFVRRMDSETNPPWNAEFECWLAADPAHATAYREVEGLWTLSREAARYPDVVAAGKRALHMVPTGPVVLVRNWLAPALAIAAALVILVGLTTFGWNALTADQIRVRYATRTGQQETIRLRDGSTLLLDADSAVVVDYVRRMRRVALLHGRAEFRVLHDKDWPFIVDAGAGAVTDVGTTFQVGIGAHDDVDVVWLEGRVSVATTSRNATLTSGEALRFNRAGIVQGPYPADLPAALGWTSGEIIADDWLLPRLLAEMNRYSDVKVEVRDATLQDVRVTGTFRAGDQMTLVDVLAAGWPIRAERISATRIELLHTRGGK